MLPSLKLYHSLKKELYTLMHKQDGEFDGQTLQHCMPFPGILMGLHYTVNKQGKC